ncbi:TenA family transcriptional regulator [Trujillonella endophytica]|uniref:Aminopyrimidine aminohydrolase n=1 Tax=Trujillonella endophytica TaxID=673521 RepID=A0A1H8VDQ4_9ACTN|nr:TenA family transcriptional regulator [Trujillella endophytica]SEP13519.1 thiaminase (transcriptional activator TenA) [Trujillella endophytica]
MPTADLRRDHPGPWERATRHPFLLGVRDGTLAPGAFDTWLVQDAHYVADLLTFQARLLARAPRAAQAVLAAGAVALVEELDWFAELAGRRGLDLTAPRLPATTAYGELLRRLDGADVPAALTALWAVERVYLDAWTAAAPGAREYAEYVAHWTTPGFAAYVDGLAAAADALGGRHDDVVLAVLDAEVAFWDMALGDGAVPAIPPGPR